MPIDLQKVLGGLLTDISQARSISDQYSVELAKAYEADELLHVFPVPRTDFKNVVIELRFAITNVETVEGLDPETQQPLPEDYHIEVSVTAAELQQLPESMISTISFTADVDNYTLLTNEQNESVLVKSSDH